MSKQMTLVEFIDELHNDTNLMVTFARSYEDAIDCLEISNKDQLKAEVKAALDGDTPGLDAITIYAVQLHSTDNITADAFEFEEIDGKIHLTNISNLIIEGFKISENNVSGVIDPSKNEVYLVLEKYPHEHDEILKDKPDKVMFVAKKEHPVKDKVVYDRDEQKVYFHLSNVLIVGTGREDKGGAEGIIDLKHKTLSFTLLCLHL